MPAPFSFAPPSPDDQLSATMTHPPQLPPDMVSRLMASALGMAGQFGRGGLSEVLKGQGVQLPEWSNRVGDVLQNPDNQLAMGIMSPIKGGGVRMGTPEFEDYPRAADVRSNMNDNLRFRDFERQQAMLKAAQQPSDAANTAIGMTSPLGKVRAAAIRTPQGVFEGPNHASIIDMLASKYGDDVYKNIEDGFITTNGKFLDRAEANKLALEQKQHLKPNVIPELFGSEDLKK